MIYHVDKLALSQFFTYDHEVLVNRYSQFYVLSLKCKCVFNDNNQTLQMLVLRFYIIITKAMTAKLSGFKL